LRPRGAGRRWRGGGSGRAVGPGATTPGRALRGQGSGVSVEGASTGGATWRKEERGLRSGSAMRRSAGRCGPTGERRELGRCLSNNADF
jgi:hypothetical protein